MDLIIEIQAQLLRVPCRMSRNLSPTVSHANPSARVTQTCSLFSLSQSLSFSCISTLNQSSFFFSFSLSCFLRFLPSLLLACLLLLVSLLSFLPSFVLSFFHSFSPFCLLSFSLFLPSLPFTYQRSETGGCSRRPAGVHSAFVGLSMDAVDCTFFSLSLLRLVVSLRRNPQFLEVGR